MKAQDIKLSVLAFKQIYTANIHNKILLQNVNVSSKDETSHLKAQA